MMRGTVVLYKWGDGRQLGYLSVAGAWELSIAGVTKEVSQSQ